MADAKFLKADVVGCSDGGNDGFADDKDSDVRGELSGVGVLCYHCLGTDRCRCDSGEYRFL